MEIMKDVLLIEGRRDGYGVDQIERTMTVGELIEWLEQFDPRMKVFLDNDRGYTYGGIVERSFDVSQFDDYEYEVESEYENDVD